MRFRSILIGIGAFLVAVILLLAWSPVFADDIAQVVALRGLVSANGEELHQGDSIDVGDRLIAEDRSFAVFQFVDGAKVTLRPNSEMIVREYSYLEGKDVGKFDLVSGGLRIITGAIAKSSPEDYKLQTPVALMGVRGTEFSIQLLD